MKRLPNLIAWSARLVGWIGLVSLFAYITWNREGIGVRGQLARLSLPTEREAALRNLLVRAGLTDGHYQLAPDAARYGYGFSGPMPVLQKRPSMLRLTARPSDRGFEDVYVCFDRNGRVAGAPLVLAPDPAPVRFVPQCAQAGSSCFVTLCEVAQTTTTGLAARNLTYHTYHMGFPKSLEVLTVTLTPTPSQSANLVVDQDDSGCALVNLVMYTWSRPGISLTTSAENVATFRWDDDQGRFVGPDHDPQGRWEVIYPLSEAVDVQE